MFRLPIVGVTSCRQQLDKYSSHTVGDKYVQAASHAGMAVVLPALDTPIDPVHVVDQLDGLLFTGSPSNVDPSFYNGEPSTPGTHHDPARDQYTLPLLREAIKRGLPIFCICRGFQELNVSLGGTLHQHVQDLPGYLDHREVPSGTLEQMYAPQHSVTITRGGFFESLGLPNEFLVNSLHSQGINKLAAGLQIEAVAPDGLIEAVSVSTHQGFAIGVQWHPEWKSYENSTSLRLFESFKEACKSYAARRDGGMGVPELS
jgi:putative glutamine amidotransferase